MSPKEDQDDQDETVYLLGTKIPADKTHRDLISREDFAQELTYWAVLLVVYSSIAAFFPIGIIEEGANPDPDAANGKVILIYMTLGNQALPWFLAVAIMTTCSYQWMVQHVSVKQRLLESRLAFILACIVYWMSVKCSFGALDRDPDATPGVGLYLMFTMAPALSYNAYWLHQWHRSTQKLDIFQKALRTPITSIVVCPVSEMISVQSRS